MDCVSTFKNWRSRHKKFRVLRTTDNAEGDAFQLAAAHAYHVAESQAYLDGNKRTAMQAALDFLEIT